MASRLRVCSQLYSVLPTGSPYLPQDIVEHLKVIELDERLDLGHKRLKGLRVLLPGDVVIDCHPCRSVRIGYVYELRYSLL